VREDAEFTAGVHVKGACMHMSQRYHFERDIENKYPDQGNRWCSIAAGLSFGARADSLQQMGYTDVISLGWRWTA